VIRYPEKALRWAPLIVWGGEFRYKEVNADKYNDLGSQIVWVPFKIRIRDDGLVAVTEIPAHP
jgi:hypothetical protein